MIFKFKITFHDLILIVAFAMAVFALSGRWVYL